MYANKPVKNQHEPKQWSSLPTLSSRLLNKAIAGFNGQTVGSVWFQAGTQKTPALAGIAGCEVTVEVCGSQEWFMATAASVVVNHIGYRAQVIEPNHKFTPLDTSTHDILNHYKISSSPSSVCSDGHRPEFNIRECLPHYTCLFLCLKGLLKG